MSDQLVTIQRADDVAVLALNDPASLNAISCTMIDQFNRALDRVVDDVGALVVTGAGRAFSAGGALTGSDGVAQGAAPGDLGITLETHINPLMSRLRALPIPWIAAVRGAAAGVGCSLALAADLVLASDTAYFLQAFVRIGLVPDGGSTFLLARDLTRVRAMEMMLLGERLPAAQALEWGLINRCVADAQLDSEALALAQRLAAGPSHALGLVRRNAWQAQEADWETMLIAERAAQREAGAHPDAAEGMAAFRDKRPARFAGR